MKHALVQHWMTSPVITIPGDITTARLSFNHWVATEFRWDGGNIKLSINGGAFNLIPQAAYTFNVPNQTLYTVAQGNSNPLAGQRAFTGSDGGSVSGSWGQSQVNLQAAGVQPRMANQSGQWYSMAGVCPGWPSCGLRLTRRRTASNAHSRRKRPISGAK